MGFLHKKLLVKASIRAPPPSDLRFKTSRMLLEAKKGGKLKGLFESLERSGSLAYGLWSFMLAQS